MKTLLLATSSKLKWKSMWDHKLYATYRIDAVAQLTKAITHQRSFLQNCLHIQPEGFHPPSTTVTPAQVSLSGVSKNNHLTIK